MTSGDAEVRRVVPATGPLDATVTVPGSKSIANRALVCAALAEGVSVLDSVAPGDDTAALIDCLSRLGVEVAGMAGVPDRLEVRGVDGMLAPGPELLPARLGGTTSRFVTALAALGPGPYTIDGDPPLRARPMAPLHEALRALGASVEANEREGYLPVTVSGGAMRGARVAMPGDVSSQYVTALMLIAPYLTDGLTIELTTTLVSRPYVEITAAVMRSFGAEGIAVGDDLVRVEPGRYVAIEYVVEPDASSASYPLAAAAIVGGRVTVEGLGMASLQGDARFAELLAAMGCDVTRTETSTAVARPVERPLTGIDVDMADLSDLVPTLAVVATRAATPTRITGVGFIRRKESDRLGDLATELRKLGAVVDVEPDGLRISPTSAWHGARLATHHDHRLAMAFGVLGLAVHGVEIEDPTVVSKSWPGFWDERFDGPS
jgi:3-phosphoshikimate 1-carboxyvinyltransferase